MSPPENFARTDSTFSTAWTLATTLSATQHQKDWLLPNSASAADGTDPFHAPSARDRKSVEEGESVSVRVDLGGRLLINNRTKYRSVGADVVSNGVSLVLRVLRTNEISN